MSALDGAGKMLGREVGGLPVIAWAGIVGVGVYAGRKLMGGRSSSGGTVTPFVDPNTTGYTASGEPATTGGAGTVGKPTFVDNLAWRRAALDYLSSIGVSGSAAEAAVAGYLNGDKFDRAMIDTVIRAIGSPPESVPTPTVPNVTTPVPGAGRSPRSTTVKAPFGLGENLNQVASRIRRPKALGGEGVTTTTTGAPLTAAYLAAVNGLTNVPKTRALKSGTRITY